jgi:hypothetical protein
MASPIALGMAMSIANVAGVDVDTRHWIGGRRIGSARTCTDVSPIDDPQLVAGTVWVNCFFVRDLRAPFGGPGLSGIGREGGTWSFDFCGAVKNTVYAPKGWRGDG